MLPFETLRNIVRNVMARTRQHGSKHEAVRKITKTAKYTYYVTIPKAYIDALGWRERQKVVVSQDGESIVIRDWK